ncbi:MAG: DNA-3-methyladenine glycosylase 2 family protein [Thaumarchaeota archaeon]|nr:DNA-3-methyladenine glycosylase 2 family protein [Nitrososphaerota archaeon]
MTVHEGVRFLKRDPIMKKVIDSVGDYTLKKRNHHFAVLVESIISQQLATRAAEVIFQRFKDLYPKFPTAPEILATKKSKLRSVGLSSMKTEYLMDLAIHMDQGKIRLGTLSKMTDEEVVLQLTQVKGIGRWTAEMFLIFSLNRPDVLPVHDLGLQKGVQKAFSLDVLPKPSEVDKIGMRWKPYRSIATWYLWKSLEKFDRIG